MEIVFLIISDHKPFIGRDVAACADLFMFRMMSRNWEEFAAVVPDASRAYWSWTKDNIAITAVPIWEA